MMMAAQRLAFQRSGVGRKQGWAHLILMENSRRRSIYRDFFQRFSCGQGMCLQESVRTLKLHCARRQHGGNKIGDGFH